MAAHVTSNATLVYGSLTIGGTSNFEPHGKFTMRVDEEAGTLTIDFPFTVTSGLSSAIDDVENLLRVQEADLTLTWDGKARSWKQSDGSGFNHFGTLIKPGHEIDSREFRHYVARVTCTLPADEGPDADGRRNATVELSVEPGGRATITMRGEYTRLSTLGARANYADKKDAYFSAKLAEAPYSTYTWDTGGLSPLEPHREILTELDDRDAVVAFVAVFEGIIHEQLDGVTDSTLLIKSVMKLQRIRRGSDDTPGGGILSPPTDLIATHTTWIRLATEADIATAWNDTVLPYLQSELVLLDDESTDFEMVEDDPILDYSEAQVTGRIVMRGYRSIAAGPLSVLGYRLKTGVGGGTPANKIAPVASGDSRAGHELFGPEAHTLVITEQLMILGTLGEVMAEIGTKSIPDLMADVSIAPHGLRPSVETLQTAGVDGKWVPLKLLGVEAEPVTRGRGDYTVDIVHLTQTGLWQHLRPAPVGGGAGDGGEAPA